MCNLFGCRHKFTAYVDEDGFQYCIKCGKAEFVKMNCVHIWEKTDSYKITTSFSTGGSNEAHQFAYHCTKCGELKVEMIDCNRNDKQ